MLALQLMPFQAMFRFTVAEFSKVRLQSLKFDGDLVHFGDPSHLVCGGGKTQS